MTLLNQAHLRELVEYDRPPCVSVFLPTNRGSREERQDAIRLKNLRGAALDRLAGRDVPREAAQTILAPLADVLADTEPSRQRGDSLACFAADGFFRAYAVPLALDEKLVVNDRFFVKPLVPLLHADARFYVLALTKDQAQLFEATRASIREIALPEIAHAEIDGPPEDLQYHSYRAPSAGRGATNEAVYHGQGGAEDRTKVDALNFFHRVDRAVGQVLRDEHAPLVLACVDYLASLYDAANSYRGLLVDHVSGSAQHKSLGELRDSAWELVEAQVGEERQQALNAWQALRAKDRASADVAQIVVAAASGRVDTLLIRPDRECWGNVDASAQKVQLCDRRQPQAVELLDYAAARTLTHGGNVFAVAEIPAADSPLAATFRY